MQYQKMNPEVKKIWLEALKSGEYKKGVDRLRSEDNAFCCLGVLCNLHAIAHPEFASEQVDKLMYDSNSATLGWNVERWSGVEDSAQWALACINDSSDSFEPVIQFIEENL